MNAFDAVVTTAVILGAVLGFMSGLVRSLATILAYLIAAPVAVAVAPDVWSLLMGNATLSSDMAWVPLFAIFLVVGVVLGAIFRHGANEFVGTDPPLIDRIGGALLGAVRILLVGVLIVVIFDRIIPADRQPAYLIGSKLRPYLSAAGQKGFASLPPDAEGYIDRLKRERGL
jgi:membrane protein required for colicin V production